MSDLQNLMEMLSALSPSELLKLTQAAQAKTKEVSELLTETKKQFLVEVCECLEDVTPPEECTVSISFDENGKIVEKAYRSGIKAKGVHVSGDGVSRGATPIPEVGSLALRTYKGTQHKLLIRGANDFVLDDRIECKSANEAYHRITGSSVNMNARRWWFSEGTVKLPPETEMPENAVSPDPKDIE